MAENPGVFGIDAAFKKLWKHLDDLLGKQDRETGAALGRIEQALRGLERTVSNMPTRAEFDAAKQALGQAISDAASRVSTDLQALRDQIAQGNPVSDADLADIQADITALGNIDPAVVPPPAP